VASLSDEDGAIVEAATYDTYGQVAVYDVSAQAVEESPVGNPYYFTGRRLDLLPTAHSPQPAAKQLYHYRARAYDPGNGRFWQRDPIGYFDAQNLYSYCALNPARDSDALGLTIVAETPIDLLNIYTTGTGVDVDLGHSLMEIIARSSGFGSVVREAHRDAKETAEFRAQCCEDGIRMEAFGAKFVYAYFSNWDSLGLWTLIAGPKYNSWTATVLNNYTAEWKVDGLVSCGKPSGGCCACDAWYNIHITITDTWHLTGWKNTIFNLIPGKPINTFGYWDIFDEQYSFEKCDHVKPGYVPDWTKIGPIR